MRASTVKSCKRVISNVAVQMTHSDMARSIAARLPFCNPLLTAGTCSPMAWTKTCFTHLNRPVPKLRRTTPNNTVPLCWRNEAHISSTDPDPPLTNGRLEASGPTNTQFQAPIVSATDRNASRPLSKRKRDGELGTETIRGAFRSLGNEGSVTLRLRRAVFTFSFVVHPQWWSPTLSTTNKCWMRERMRSWVTSATWVTSRLRKPSHSPVNTCCAVCVSSLARQRRTAGQLAPFMCRNKVFSRWKHPDPKETLSNAHCTEESFRCNWSSLTPPFPAPQKIKDSIGFSGNRFINNV
mmetsp:Transcript_61178/g.162582  ORF Transcript_61178/g.162582 Transcript_61178/m.162582 type:complete len:295 (+) Transcript_61178:968-1852(+)